MTKFLKIIFFLFILSGRLFGVDPQDYQKNSDLQMKWNLESLKAFPFNQGDKVLHVGCRSGVMTLEIAANVPQGIVLGIDSDEMINYAKEHYPSTNVIYMKGDLRKLPFIEQFDKAVALLCLHWINEQGEVLDSLYQSLKPNGKAIITFPGKQPSNLGPVVYNLVKEDRWISYFPNFQPKRFYYTDSEYRVLLENAGFVVEQITYDSVYTRFKDREALTGFFRPLCNFIDHLSLSQQEQFLDEIIDNVIAYNQILSDGSIVIHDFKMEAIISKPF